MSSAVRSESIHARDAAADSKMKPTHRPKGESYNRDIPLVRAFTAEEALRIEANVGRKLNDGVVGDPAVTAWAVRSLLEL